MLATLQWRVQCCTPHHFLDHFVARLPFSITPEQQTVLVAHADTLLDMCSLGASHALHVPH